MSEEKRDQGFSLLAQVLAHGARRPLTLLEQYTIDNRVYKNERINLDGYTFRNCAFINCDLNTAKGNFRLQDC